MEEYFCPECNKKIEYGVLKCPHCHEEIDWVNSQEEKVTKKNITEKIYRPIYKDLVDTYNFFLNSATAVLIVILIFAGVLFFFGLIAAGSFFEESDLAGLGVLFSTFFTTGFLVLLAILAYRTLKYKGYMLKSIHEINLNIKNRK